SRDPTSRGCVMNAVELADLATRQLVDDALAEQQASPLWQLVDRGLECFFELFDIELPEMGQLGVELADIDLLRNARGFPRLPAARSSVDLQRRPRGQDTQPARERTAAGVAREERGLLRCPDEQLLTEKLKKVIGAMAPDIDPRDGDVEVAGMRAIKGFGRARNAMHACTREIEIRCSLNLRRPRGATRLQIGGEEIGGQLDLRPGSAARPNILGRPRFVLSGHLLYARPL